MEDTVPVPMEPVPWPAAFDAPGWLWQVKWDGVRLLAAAPGPRLWSRRGRDCTGAFPELHAALEACAAAGPVLLDGEAVALGPDGTPSFPLILRRSATAHPHLELTRRVPVVYAVFDVLAWAGGELRHRPLEERLDRLEGLPAAPCLHRVPAQPGGGPALLARLAAAGLEGAVAKRAGSPYVPGPSPLWRKVKVRRTLSCAVVGCQQAPAGRVRSLCLAAEVGGAPAYVGQVASGLSEETRAALRALLPGLPRWHPPFPVPADGAQGHHHWFGPLLTATVSFAEWTPQAHLRAPALQRLQRGLLVASDRGLW